MATRSDLVLRTTKTSRAAPVQDLWALLQYIGLEEMRDKDDEIGARCPMHKQRTGALENRPEHWSVNKATGDHHCFSCKYSGTLQTLIMDAADLDNFSASRLIRQYGVVLNLRERLEQAEPIKTKAVPSVEIERFGPPPAKALAKRNITAEAAEHFGLRWDREKGWIIPVRLPSGTLVGWQEKSSEGVLNRPRSMKKAETLFGAFEARNGGRVVVVESPLDCAYLWDLGYTAVALFGSSMSTRQRDILLSTADSVVLALDNDPAGWIETERLALGKVHKGKYIVRVPALHTRIETFVFRYDRFTKAKDVGEMEVDEVVLGIEGAVLGPLWRRPG